MQVITSFHPLFDSSSVQCMYDFCLFLRSRSTRSSAHQHHLLFLSFLLSFATFCSTPHFLFFNSYGHSHKIETPRSDIGHLDDLPLSSHFSADDRLRALNESTVIWTRCNIFDFSFLSAQSVQNGDLIAMKSSTEAKTQSSICNNFT